MGSPLQRKLPREMWNASYLAQRSRGVLRVTSETEVDVAAGDGATWHAGAMSFAGPLAALFARPPVVLAPMEDVSDLSFRRLCRELGADVTMTEFIRAEGLVAQSAIAARKIRLGPDDRPTGIQIYGADARLLREAAEVAAAAAPQFVDINCGCWVPRVARGGAGASWLRRPAAMVAMAAEVAAAAAPLPVTVKTRIGWGDEAQMPIVEVAQRLEDVGIAAITVHCRTARMGHAGRAEWSWAARVQRAVRIPVIVNGDIRSADDAQRALDETGAAGVMIGRAAIDGPWIFRQVRALLERGERVPAAELDERLDLYGRVLRDNVAQRGPRFGVAVTRRHARPWFAELAGGERLRARLIAAASEAECLAVLADARAAARAA
jgi:nifR3 family TIM-barrel protein